MSRLAQIKDKKDPTPDRLTNVDHIIMLYSLEREELVRALKKTKKPRFRL